MRAFCIIAALASPAAADRPSAATRRLVVELAGNRARVLELVDPAVGLVFLDHFLEPGEPPGTTSEQHLCGAAIHRFLRETWAREIAPAIRRANANKTLACHSATECRFGGAGEWDPVWHVKLAAGRGGKLALRAITQDDEVLVDPADVAKEHAEQDKLVAALATRCP